MWSRPIEVMAVASGSATVTASSRPPSPVSSTATSTLLFGEGEERQRGGDLEVGERNARRDDARVERGQPIALDSRGRPPGSAR